MDSTRPVAEHEPEKDMGLGMVDTADPEMAPESRWLDQTISPLMSLHPRLNSTTQEMDSALQLFDR